MRDPLELKLKVVEVTSAARHTAHELIKYQNAQAWADGFAGDPDIQELARIHRKLFETQLHQLLERCGELAAEAEHG